MSGGGCPQTYRLQVSRLHLKGLEVSREWRARAPTEAATDRSQGTETQRDSRGAIERGQRKQDRAQDRQNVKRGAREGNKTERRLNR